MPADSEVLDREATRVVKQIGIPPCPAILTKLMQEMRSDDPDFDKLGSLISGDVSLAATMLKTVNSPFYGLASKATSISQAIALLGLRQIGDLVTSLLLRQVFPEGASDEMDEFWEVQSGITAINLLLARNFKQVNRDALQTFGLFRDCGMLVMLQKVKNYKAVFPGPKACAIAQEGTRYGFNHAQVGHRMATAWLLPEAACQAVLKHHDYAELEADGAGVPVANRQHIALTLMAESIYVKSELGVPSAEWTLGGSFALTQMGITQEELDAMGEEVLAELRTRKR